MLPWKVYIRTSEMSISSCLSVNRSSQIKHLDNSRRAKVKVLTNDLNQLCIRKFTGSECFYVDRCRMSNTDRIGKLNLTFICKTCCNNIFCNITCSIRCGTVYLCTVFTGESTAAMTSGSTVSINDDLTSGKSTVIIADFKISLAF